MKKIFHIAQGWFASLIWTSKEIKKLSDERLSICNSCPYAVEKSFLKILRDSAIEEKKKACKFCGCPIYEKSLVKNEHCEINLWKK